MRRRRKFAAPVLHKIIVNMYRSKSTVGPQKKQTETSRLPSTDRILSQNGTIQI